MAQEFFNYTEILYDEFTDKEYSSLAEVPLLPSNNTAYIEYEIEANYVYRPDKISYKFYNTSDLDWLIDEVNGFSSLNEYYVSRKIKVLKLEVLEKIGISK